MYLFNNAHHRKKLKLKMNVLQCSLPFVQKLHNLLRYHYYHYKSLTQAQIS